MEEQRAEMVPAEVDRRSEPEAVTERARLSPEAARTITDAIKVKAEELWTMLLDAYEGGAHLALGYGSWGDYFEAEFGGDHSYGYRLLDSGRVVRAIEAHSPIGERPNEAQARELAPLARENPEDAAEVWTEVVKSTEGRPTARAVKEAVSGTSEAAAKPEDDANRESERPEVGELPSGTGWMDAPLNEFSPTSERGEDGLYTGRMFYPHGEGPAQSLMDRLSDLVEQAYSDNLPEEEEGERFEVKGEVPIIRDGRRAYASLYGLAIKDLPAILDALVALEKEREVN